MNITPKCARVKRYRLKAHKYLNCKVDKNNERCVRAGKATAIENSPYGVALTRMRNFRAVSMKDLIRSCKLELDEVKVWPFSGR